jgi:hypothetical protein
MSFSQEAGVFGVLWFIGFIPTIKGCGIDRAVEVLLCTFFLSDRQDR